MMFSSSSDLLQVHDIFVLQRIGEISYGKDLIDPLIHPHKNAELSPQNIYYCITHLSLSVTNDGAILFLLGRYYISY